MQSLLNVERPSYEQAAAYIRANCVNDRKSKKKAIFEVIKPLKVFKKARANDPYSNACAIISLQIPVGALIYAGEGWGDDQMYDLSLNCRKMRASEAYVHSIADIGNGYCSMFDKAVSIKEAFSKWDNNFKYTKGETVNPELAFSKNNDACKSGIHFFLNPHDAVNY